jgi:hypothetical protein
MMLVLNCDCVFQGDFFMSRMHSRNMWVFDMMPLEKTTEINLAWNEVVYIDTQLDRAPEESTPTLVTKQLQARKDSLVRWNKGAQQERGAYLSTSNNNTHKCKFTTFVTLTSCVFVCIFTAPKGKRDFWLQVCVTLTVCAFDTPTVL